MLERAENAMNICLEKQKTCETEANKCTSIKKDIEGIFNKVNKWGRYWKDILDESELTHVRCAAILAAACILQLLLAVYYTLCHFNII